MNTLFAFAILRYDCLIMSDALLNLPNTVIGEIIDGELVVSPRPTGPHIFTSSSLGEELTGPFTKGKGGGPGGWCYNLPEINNFIDTFNAGARSLASSVDSTLVPASIREIVD